jgi:hypothetical protein
MIDFTVELCSIGLGGVWNFSSANSLNNAIHAFSLTSKLHRGCATKIRLTSIKHRYLGGP